jgi:uncharacterized protein (UPF0333 family)
MSGKMIAGVVIGLIVMVTAYLAGTYIHYHNLGVSYETKLEATWKENKVTLNTYTTKVKEVAQVPDMYRDDLQKVIQSTFEGRYGADGSKAVFQFIREQNMPLDPTLYQKIQQVMESGRNEFQMSQKVLIDTRAAYERQLGYFWSGLWLNIAGYPKVDLEKYKIVTIAEVEQKFETGQDEVIKLR